MGTMSAIGKRMVPHVPRLAPDLNSSFVHESLRLAIRGAGPLPPAARAAERQLEEQRGDLDKGIREVVENHVTYAAVEGFVTNLGGLVTAPLTIPANVTGLALIQGRMVAGIAHLRGYDIDDPRVHNAMLSCLLGESTVKALVKKRQLPARPLAIATAPAHDPDLDRVVAGEVTSFLVERVLGKQAATAVFRRVPVVGGAVGASADGYATWQVGRYAARELLTRAPAIAQRPRSRR
jgi:hypothetical protein